MNPSISQTQPDLARKAQLAAELSKIVEAEERAEARQVLYDRALYSRDQVRGRLDIGRQKLAEYTQLAEERLEKGGPAPMSLGEFVSLQYRACYDQNPPDNALDWLEKVRWDAWRLSYVKRWFIPALENEVAEADALFAKFCSTNGWPAPTA